jgi:AcrR family transcriptional regulator
MVSGMHDTDEHRGRPRDPGVDDAILRAAAELLAETGVEATTVTAVAARAGVARATVYLRWPSRWALIGAATKASVGGRPYPLTGDIARDIQVGAHFFRDIIAAPRFKAMFPHLVAEVLAEERGLPWDALSPNRARLASNYASVAGSQGFAPQLDPDLPYDLSVGALLAHLLVNGEAPSHEWTQQLADVIVAGLRALGRDRGPAPRD